MTPPADERKGMGRERPILFSAPMVRALLAGTKTQTRRIVKADMGRETNLVEWNTAERAFVPWNWHTGGSPAGGGRTGKPFACPYGVVGDRLWVRETWSLMSSDRRSVMKHGYHSSSAEAASVGLGAAYRASEDHDHRCWRPGIHMPRWASRITLEVTGVRVERLHDITEDDARAEGVHHNGTHWIGGGEHLWPTARAAFESLWCAINGLESWRANPWVWVVSFRRVEAQERAA